MFKGVYKIEYIMNSNDFAVRALHSVCRHCFHKLNPKEKEIIGNMLYIISTEKTNFDTIVKSNIDMFRKVYDILYLQTDLTPTLTNYAGIVLGKMEDIFSEDDDH